MAEERIRMGGLTSRGEAAKQHGHYDLWFALDCDTKERSTAQL